MKEIQIKRSRHRLLPDARRVLAKPYLPGEETLLPGPSRAHLLIARILAIPEAQVKALNAEILERFEGRHRRFSRMLEQQFETVVHHIVDAASLSADRRLLIGAYFTHEFAVEAAALFNPSIVLAPDQRGLANGAQRFVMSLRAVGEGHLSSIEFRSGVLDADGGIVIDDPGTHLVGGRRASPSHFEKSHFRAKLVELGAINELSASVLARLAPQFTIEELEASLSTLDARGPSHALWFETAKIIRVLASSNYVTTFPADSQLAERVIFPAGPNETRGMEDARFVRFTDADGGIKYYATYTAYDGFEILPQLIETEDFVRFTISTLNGAAAQNKGMALFPRTLAGKYVMLSRKDRENLHLSISSDLHYWDDVTELYRPQHPWELLQIGNCGSPIETEAGWLVLTHGVGPMRRYAIGAMLLDLDDPRHVIGHLAEPLIEPEGDEREGYVPNVVYTCGAIVHADQLIVPYGFSDAGVAIAQLPLSDLLEALRLPLGAEPAVV
ncbi:MAG TPA: glycoside hydrolase family 130 protein [Gammaproteobacteria bacterium]|nr:glycoside hydrolase family 130 protein [Gammaproteobacteria bacterium]